MTMPEFIESNLEDILIEWDQFAGTLRPAATGLDQKSLRNFAAQVLRTIVEDMRRPETLQEQTVKSRGQRPEAHPPLTVAARTHAGGRLTDGFTLDQMVSEYRALRASVVRRWKDQVGEAGPAELDELTRFNEALDASLTSAIEWYSERLEQARDLYTGALAHDLRNPLGAILTSAEVLAQTSDSGGAAERLAGQILGSGRRMKEMTDDLLDFTRTRLGGGLAMDLEAQDMAILAQLVADEVKAQARQCDVRLDVPQTLPGTWDGLRIQQMLSNLLGNALRYCASGSNVLLRAQAKGDQVMVEVHNQGPAIPADLQRNLFNPLTRAAVPESKRSSTGLGLGLYIARQIAEAHGGTIDLTSSEDQGTTFTVTLPRESEAAQETAGIV